MWEAYFLIYQLLRYQPRADVEYLIIDREVPLICLELTSLKNVSAPKSTVSEKECLLKTGARFSLAAVQKAALDLLINVQKCADAVL